MIIDRYLLPILEISVSIAIPLVLTLKAVDVVLNCDLSQKPRLLSLFWLNFWFIMFFIEISGMNSHFRTLFTIYYLSQHHFVSNHLVRFYKLNLTPFITKMLTQFMNLELTEADTDYYFGLLLNRVCFDDKFLNKVINVFCRNDSDHSESRIMKMVQTIPQGAIKNHTRTSPYSEKLDINNLIEEIKVKAVKKNKNKKSRFNSATNKPKGSSIITNSRMTTNPLTKIPSPKVNAKIKNYSNNSIKSEDHLLLYPDHKVYLMSPDRIMKNPQPFTDQIIIRDPSDDVFDDSVHDIMRIPGDRRSFRAGLKSMFTI